MEKSTVGCRIILTSTSTTKIIEPLRSRCLVMRVPAPSNNEITAILTDVAKKQGIILPSPLAIMIARDANRNLRRALLAFEAAKVLQYPFVLGQKPPRAEWELFIAKMAVSIHAEQTPQRCVCPLSDCLSY
jgi:replication factor C subunit 3/5